MTNIDPKKLLDMLNADPDALRDHLRSLLPAPTMAEVEWDDDEHAGLCAENPDREIVRMIHPDWDGDIQFIYMGSHGISQGWAEPSELTPIPGTRVDLTPRLPEDDQAEPEDVLAASIEDYKAGRFVDFNIDTPLPRPEDVPTGEVWAVDMGGHGEWIGVRNDPEVRPQPWFLIRIDSYGWTIGPDSKVTLLHRLTPEETAVVTDHPQTLTTEEDYQDAPDGTIVAMNRQWPWSKGASQWHGYSTVSSTSSDLAGHERKVLRWGWKA